MFWERNSCRICGSTNLFKYLDFGDMPVATSFKKAEDSPDDKIPLAVNFCEDCGLSQLSVVVEPSYIFSPSYPYNSSVSRTFQEHCFEMAKSLKKMFGDSDGLKILDVASNDGCLLKEFRKNGFACIGVDPATKLVEKANKDGIETICAFWDKEVARKIVDNFGKADIVTATNVFAHIDDVHDFVESAKIAMSEDGVFVIEFGYAKNLLEQNEFDTVLHEHLSYYLVNPLAKLFSMHDMKISDIIAFEKIHGGSLRVVVVKNGNSKIKVNESVVRKYLQDEKEGGLLDHASYLSLEKEAQQIKKETRDLIKSINSRGQIVAGYGAPVKGNTFINFCELTKEDIPFIVDDTKDKQGLVYAGPKIPIVPNNWIVEKKPDYLLILAWNFAEEIMNKTQEFSQVGGKYIIAIPKPKVVDLGSIGEK